MKRDNITVYRGWQESLADLTLEEQGLAWRAIFDYAFDGIEPQDRFIKAVTALIRQHIDKEAEIGEKRAQAGRLGALKRRRTKLDNSQQLSKAPQTGVTQNEVVKKEEFSLSSYNAAISQTLDEFISQNEIALEAFCMNNRLDMVEFKALAAEVLTEWHLSGADISAIIRGRETNKSSHLINCVRVKKQKNMQDGNSEQDRFSKRRGIEADAKSPKDYEGSF